jgi:hypothetical protein
VVKQSNSKVLFEPFPKQQQFIEAVFSGKYSFLCYGGAMGGGKSFVCLAVLILLAKVYPRSKWCVIRESLPTLKKTSLETFKKLVPTNFVKSYNQQEQIYTFQNDSQIMFMSEDFAHDKDFDRFKGLEVNGFLLEQIEELQEKLLEVCFVRAGRWLIDKMPPRPLILANVNPTLSWPKLKVFDRYVKRTLPNDWFYEPAKISDNPVLYNDVNYMHNVTAHLDDLTRRRLIDGDWSAFAVDKPYLYNFSIDKHIVHSYKPNPHLPILVSFDFNVEPMTATVGQKIDDLTGYIFDEFEINNGSTEEMCALIRAKYKDWYLNTQVTGDASGRNRTAITQGNLNHYRVIKDSLQLLDRDLLVPKTNPQHKDSRVHCNSVLQHAKFYLTGNCEKVKMDCIYAQVDEFGELVKTKEQGRHFFDGYRYMCHAFYPDFISRPEKYRR